MSITEFAHDPELPRPPVARPVIRHFNLVAIVDGDTIVSRVQEVSRFTNLSEEQKTELGCFLAQKAVAGEISLEPARPRTLGLQLPDQICHPSDARNQFHVRDR